MKTYSDTDTDLTLSRATTSDLVNPSGAEPTSRLLPDHQSDLVEWSESATIDGVFVKAYYMTTPEDEELAGESGAWDAIKWDERLDRIVIDIVACDRADIDDSAIDALIARLG